MTALEVFPLHEGSNVGALINSIIKLWGPLYYNCNKEPPKIVLVAIQAPYST